MRVSEVDSSTFDVLIYLIYNESISDDDGAEDPSIEVSNSQPSQVIYERESKIKIDYSSLEEGN